MKDNDDIIKKTLQSNIQRIEDDFFTRRIVEVYLAKRQVNKNRSFLNFMSLIIGISSVIASFGLVLIIRQNNNWITQNGLTEKHGFILIILSVVFLIYKGLEEFTAPSWKNQWFRS
jgi:hypothetical protein